MVENTGSKCLARVLENVGLPAVVRGPPVGHRHTPDGLETALRATSFLGVFNE